MNQETRIEQLEKEIKQLRQDLIAINEEFYRNNFSGRQDFFKYSDFRTMLKVPNYSTLPSTCQVGEVVESSGKLRVCSATDTWTIVGTQS